MSRRTMHSHSSLALDEAVCARFERRAAAIPDHPAIIMDEGTVTFRELNAMVNRIAAALAPYQCSSEEPLAIIAREGPLLYAVMLAIAKLGRIFVPLNPTSPEAWLSEILAVSGARYVLTDKTTHSIGLRIAPASSLVLESERLESFTVQSAPDLPVSSSAVLCVLYTSGSTGRPKGVIISHRTTVHRASVRNKHVRGTDRMAHLRSSVFAGGINDMFSSLLNGVTLCPYDVKKSGLHELSHWLAARSITGLVLSSSVLRAWLETIPTGFQLSQLRLIVAASEPLHGADVRRLARHLEGDWTVVNQLGSTEAGPLADQTFGPASEMEEGILPVGRAVEDFEIHLENENGNLAGPGEAGEIIICSRYLARGYWKDPVLTAERFSSDPTDPSVSVYRTGDLGRWRSDGLLEFLGRKDRRIKLRGYSIDLYEVEQALLRLPAVREAVVLVEDSGKRRLVGYVASETHVSARLQDMRTELLSKLPSYMVPPEIIVLPSLPLTPRGKVDRKALLSSELRKKQSSRAPESDLECRLAQIWRDVLKIPEVGVQDDFFVIGGDSLQATEVILELEKEFGVVLPAEVMFSKASTIAGMAAEVEKARASGRVSVNAGGPSPANDQAQRDVDFAEFQPPRSARDNPGAFYVDPRTRFRRAKPGQHYMRVVFNAQGYRNPELIVPKPAGTVRIAFLGGSTTLDTFVSGNEAAWPNVTCEKLRLAFPGVSLDYLNGGLPGFNTRGLIVLFKEYVAAFEPDVVVIFSSDHNADTAYLARKKGLYHGAHFQPSWLAKRFRVWHLAEKNLTILARLFRAQYAKRRLDVSNEELTAGFEERLERLVRLCQAQSRVVMLMTTAGRLRRSQSGFERMRSAVTNVFFMPYMSIEGILDLYDMFDEAIRRVGRRTGAVVIEPKLAIPPDSLHYVDSSHFRDEGSKRIATFVASSLADCAEFRALLAEGKAPVSAVKQDEIQGA